jgi:oligopeptide/dipeptide ABC transporter ATP-binding protein
MRKVRWTEIAVVPQSAMNALNPVYRVGPQIEEVIVEHMGVGRAEARRRAEVLFRLVKIAPDRLDHFPHQFSGGMRQRALVAMALAVEPSLLIADEPTTALDVVTQDRIFTRVRALQTQLGASMLLITHDMGLVAENCDRVAVMYAGKIVETADTRRLFGKPVHPYTLGLKNAFPSTTRPKSEALISIAGSPPVLLDPPHACRFAPRCPFATDLCREEEPDLVEVGPGHLAACHYADKAQEMRKRAARLETWASGA